MPVLMTFILSGSVSAQQSVSASPTSTVRVMERHILDDGTIVHFGLDMEIGLASMSFTNPRTGAVQAEVLDSVEMREVARILLVAADDAERLNGRIRVDLNALLERIRSRNR